jgi:hypothetical protein
MVDAPLSRDTPLDAGVCDHLERASRVHERVPEIRNKRVLSIETSVPSAATTSGVSI